MSHLFFPRPASAGCDPSSSSVEASASTSASTSASAVPSSSSTTSRWPPNNFAEMRSEARAMRKPKSPFMPRRGKDLNLSNLDEEELRSMIERNRRMLADPKIVTSLPGGSVRILDLQARLTSRLKELESVHKIRNDLEATHIDPDRKPQVASMEEVEEYDHDDEKKPTSWRGTSPRTKERIVEAHFGQRGNALISSIPLTESIALQRLAVERNREEEARKAAQMEIEVNRPVATGKYLQSAWKNNPSIARFMLQFDDPSSDEEDIEDDFATNPEENGQLDEEEHLELNPLRAAYEQGYNRAREDERAGGG